jgi:hypothetical protein
MINKPKKVMGRCFFTTENIEFTEILKDFLRVLRGEKIIVHALRYFLNPEGRL